MRQIVRRTFRHRVLVLVAPVMVASLALSSWPREAKACTYVELGPDIASTEPLPSTFGSFEAPRGGVWWFEHGDDEVPATVTLTHPELELQLQAEVVARGPIMMGVRVPADAPVGERFFVEGVEPVDGVDVMRVTVSEGDAPTPPAVLDASGLAAEERVFKVRDGCFDYNPFDDRELVWQRVTGSLEAPDDFDATRLLADIWIVESGEPIPDDAEARPYDSVSVAHFFHPDPSPPTMEFAFNLAVPGTWDIHVRFRDLLTAETSNVEMLTVTMDETERRGCSASTDAAPAVGLLSLLMLLRRRRSVTCRRR